MSTSTPQHPDTLVTGATGFLGSVLVRQLVEAGRAVRIFRRPSSRMDLLEREDVAGVVEHASGTLADARSLRRALRGVRRIYHVAALVGPGRRPSRQALRRVNVEGTAHLVDAALAAEAPERLIFTSSVSALGPPAPDTRGDGAPLIDETASWSRAGRSPSPYGRSKRDAEREVHRGIAEGLDAVIVNPALVFGRGRKGEGTRRLVDLAQRGRLVAAPPGATCTADVEDVADGHRRAMRLGETGRRYMLGGDNLSWHALFATLAGAFGNGPPRFTLPPALLKTAGAAADLFSLLTRLPSGFSRRSARSLTTAHRYANRRAREELDCRFRPFAQTAGRLARQLR